ncbi:MAG TPA: 30S ribosomal protein S5, partial [Methanomassiliicoccaceae archaeon]|nr:30S ribosomal protein S5 [Methanomassiliicoccaceae archaeon]
MADWIPKTKLGKMVLNGEITTMSQALATKLPLREPEIVDILLPELKDEVLDLNMVQRMTDSGRRVRFAVTCAVGNGDGFIGLGRAKGK